MKIILCLFLSLLSISAFSSDLHQLAHSKKLGVKVLVESKDDKWCSNAINLHFKADKAAFFQGQEAQLLMSKLSKIIESECSDIEKSNIIGYALNPDFLLLEAVALKQNNWKIISKKRERQSISLDSLASVPEKMLEKDNKIPSASLKLIEENTISSKQAPDDAKLDILGIQLGMMPKEVKKVLKDIKFKGFFKKNHLTDTTMFHRKAPNSEYIWGIDASPANKKISDRLQIYFAPPPNNNEVIYIKRERGYFQNGPSMTNLIPALEKKYNKPTYVEFDRNYSWIFSGNKDNKTACTYIGKNGSSTNNTGFDNLIFDNCGLTFNVKIRQKKGIVRNMEQRLFDGLILKKFNATTKQWWVAYEAKVEQEKIQKANAIAVPNL